MTRQNELPHGDRGELTVTEPQLPEVLGNSLAKGLARQRARNARRRLLQAMRHPANRPRASRFGAVVRARKQMLQRYGTPLAVELATGKRRVTLLYLCPMDGGDWMLAADRIEASAGCISQSTLEWEGGARCHAVQRVIQARLDINVIAGAFARTATAVGTIGKNLSGLFADDRGLWVWRLGWLVTFIPKTSLDRQVAQWEGALEAGGWLASRRRSVACDATCEP